jgi:hypothetical protein
MELVPPPGGEFSAHCRMREAGEIQPLASLHYELETKLKRHFDFARRIGYARRCAEGC